MRTVRRPGLHQRCHAPDRSAVHAHGARRRPLPVLAISTMEAARSQHAGTDTHVAPSRAVVIGGSVAGLLSAAVAAPFFDEVSASSAHRFCTAAPVDGTKVDV